MIDNQDKEFSAEESLRLISSMIETTKHSFRDNSHYYLLWGWAIILASLGQYYLKVIVHYPKHYLVWMITPVVVCIQVILVLRERKKEKVKTFINDAGAYLWTAIGLSFFATSFIFARIGWEYCYPFYIVLYGIGIYVAGSLIKFRPLIIGGILCFPLTIITSFLDNDTQIIMLAVAVLVSYLIPGYLLRAKFKKQKANV